MKIITISSDNNFWDVIDRQMNFEDKKYDVLNVSYEDFLKVKNFTKFDEDNKPICLLDQNLGKDKLLFCLNKIINDAICIVCDIENKKQMEAVINGIKSFYYKSLSEDDKLQIKTFGRFDVYSHGKLINFKRNKTKELLAILIDNKGSVVSTKTMADLMYEDGKFDLKRQKEMHVYLSDLRNTLDSVGHSDVLVKSSLGYSINLDSVSCDYYKLLKGEKDIVYSYDGKYMYQYSWSETTNSYIEANIKGKKYHRGGGILNVF